MGEAKNIYFTCLKKVSLEFRIMGRMHAPGKGISQSALPYRRSLPTWLKLSSEDVKEQIYKLAKKGLTPSQIGVILRDSHGVAQVKFVTGTKVLRILKAKGLASEIPEDLYHMIKKAVSIGWRVTTRPSASCHQPGNTNLLPLPLSLPKRREELCHPIFNSEKKISRNARSHARSVFIWLPFPCILDNVVTILVVLNLNKSTFLEE